jgi:hypothetical protein
MSLHVPALGPSHPLVCMNMVARIEFFQSPSLSARLESGFLAQQKSAMRTAVCLPDEERDDDGNDAR